MNKLIVHIGLTKTGTSTLQKFLALNNEVLYKWGYCYPDTSHNFEKKEMPEAGRYNNGGYIPFALGWNETVMECQEMISKELENRNVVLVDENITVIKYSMQGRWGGELYPVFKGGLWECTYCCLFAASGYTL